MTRGSSVLFLCCVLGCGARSGVREPPRASTVLTDAGPRDAGPRDAGAPDTFARDGGPEALADALPDAADRCVGVSLAGTWTGPGARARITQSGDTLSGTWITNMRPPFSGSISGADTGCIVTVTFPDDATFVATARDGGCRIDWSNGTIWTRDDCP